MDPVTVRGDARRFRRWTRWTVDVPGRCVACAADVAEATVYTRSPPRETWCVTCTDEARGVTTFDLDRFGDPSRYVDDLGVLDRVIAAQGWCTLPSDAYRTLAGAPVDFRSTHAVAADVGLLLPDVPWWSAPMTGALLAVFADVVAEMVRDMDGHSAQAWAEDAARASHVGWALVHDRPCAPHFGADHTPVAAGRTVAQIAWALDLAGPDDPPLSELLAGSAPPLRPAWRYWPPGSLTDTGLPGPLRELAEFVHRGDACRRAGDLASWPEGTDAEIARCAAALDASDPVVVAETLWELIGVAFDPEDRVASLNAFVDRCRPEPF